MTAGLHSTERFVIVYGPALVFASGTALAALTIVRNWPKVRNLHWTEQARRVWPVRASAQTAALVWNWFWLASFAKVSLRDWSTIERVGWFFYVAVACCAIPWATAELVIRRLPARKGSRSLTGGWWHGFLWLAEPAFAALILGLPKPSVAFAVAGAIAWRLAAFQGWFLGLLVIPPRHREAVQAALTKHPDLKVGMVQSRVAQAMAFPNRVVLTSALVDLLTPEQTASVACHEAAHLAAPNAWWLRRLYATAPVLALVALRFLPLPWSLGAAAAVGLVVATGLLSKRFVLAEHAADEVVDRDSLAQALERLHEWQLIPAVLAGPSSHPPLVERLERLGYAPNWPKPEPPVSTPFSVGTYALLMIVFVASYGAFSDAKGDWLVVFGASNEAPTRHPSREGIYRLLADGRCAEAAASLDSDASSALRKVVDDCSKPLQSSCAMIFSTPADELAEHALVGAKASALKVHVDRAFLLRQGLRPPQGDGNEIVELTFSERLQLEEADARGLKWRSDEGYDLVPWSAVVRLQGAGRCWVRW